MNAHDPSHPSTSLPGGVTPTAAQRVTSLHLLEAELQSLTQELSNNRPTLADQEPRARRSTLVARRSELLAKLRDEQAAITASQELVSTNLWRTLSSINDVLTLWNVAPTPNMTESEAQIPGVPGTNGEITTVSLGPGEVAFSGTPDDDGTEDPDTPKWWVHSWQCQIPIPRSLSNEKAVLAYRFSVDNETHIERDPAYAGSIAAFVTVGSAPDVSEPVDNLNTVGWPVNVTLPSNTLNFSSGVPVSGGIVVPRHGAPVIVVICGVIVSVASGYVQFLWGNFGTRRTLPSGQVIAPGDYGKIEYRYYEPWWLNTVAGGLGVATPPL